MGRNLILISCIVYPLHISQHFLQHQVSPKERSTKLFAFFSISLSLSLTHTLFFPFFLPTPRKTFFHFPPKFFFPPTTFSFLTRQTSPADFNRYISNPLFGIKPYPPVDGVLFLKVLELYQYFSRVYFLFPPKLIVIRKS